MKCIVDTNVLVSALLGGKGLSNVIFLQIFSENLSPFISPALLFEYLDVLQRDDLWASSVFDKRQRDRFLDAYLSYCEMKSIYYRWRPNLRDESDNHLIELAVAAQARMIITYNVRDFQRADLTFGEVLILPPHDALQLLKKGT